MSAELVRLLHEIDGQLGLAVHRREGCEQRWIAEADELIGRIRRAIPEVERPPVIDPRPLIARMLRQIAGWGSSIIVGSELDKLDVDELRRLADEVENSDPAGWYCCPLCEEITCDDDCPLAEFRGALG